MAVLDRAWLRWGNETPFYGIAVCRNCGDDYAPASEDDDLCSGCKSAPVLEEQIVEPRSFACPTCRRAYLLGSGESVYCCDGWLWFSDNG